MLEHEADVERFLTRLIPTLARGWRGAEDSQIARIEELAGRPLPGFYRWFLQKMGNSMGPLVYASLDFSAARIIQAYDECLVVPDPRYLLIAVESDPQMPLHQFYDLDTPMSDDALVISRPAEGGSGQVNFETLREMLTWGALVNFRILKSAQTCKGNFKTNIANLMEQLEPSLNRLGFLPTLPVGRYCGLFERNDMAMACSATPAPDDDRLLFFRLGGEDHGAMRKVLGEIALGAGVACKVKSWEPPLGGNW